MKSIRTFGFALPTVLIASVVLLMVLVTSVSVTVAVRTALRDQQYTRLAQLASEAGTAYANACLAKSNNIVTWSNAKPLKPNTDCSGNTLANVSAYVLEHDNLRTYFTVDEPVAMSIKAKGYVEALRTSNGVAWRIWSNETASAQAVGDGLPVGTSLDGYWTTAPAGYLLENGSAVSRTTYADLFAVIGTTFGAGNGSTTFNLPDSRGRVAVNKSTDTEFDALGEKQGAKTHTLTVAEIPNINGTFRALAWSGAQNQAPTGAFTSSTQIANDRTASVSSGFGTTQYTFNIGGGQPHNNIQPSIVVLRVIKY